MCTRENGKDKTVSQSVFRFTNYKKVRSFLDFFWLDPFWCVKFETWPTCSIENGSSGFVSLFLNTHKPTDHHWRLFFSIFFFFWGVDNHFWTVGCMEEWTSDVKLQEIFTPHILNPLLVQWSNCTPRTPSHPP